MNNTDLFLDSAFEAFNAGNYAEAEQLCREVLTLSPSQGDALYLLGMIAYQAGSLEAAEKLLYEAVKLYPAMKHYANMLAFVLQKQGRLDEALSFYEKNREDPIVMAQIGMIYLQKNQNDFAQSAFDEALKMNPNTAEALVGYGLIARKNGEGKKAVEYFQHATRFEAPEAFYQLAVQYRLTGYPQEALEAIQKAIHLQPLASFYNEQGLIFEAMDNLDDALDSYNQAIELDSYAPDAYANQGNIYQKKGLPIQAEDSYKRALALDNRFLEAHHNLASVLYKAGRKSEALEHYREVLILDRYHVSSLYNLALILEENGDWVEALGLYFNILSLKAHPHDIDFRIESSLTHLFEKDSAGKKEALRFAKGWIKHFPDNVVAQHTYKTLTNGTETAEEAAAYSKEFYEHFAETYDAKMAELESNVLDAIVRLIPEKEFKKVLDLACGTGTLSDKLKYNFNIFYGVDIAEKMLKKAADKQKYTKLCRADALSFLKSNKTKFDLIVASELVCYLPSVLTLFQEVSTHLLKNGLFVFSVEACDKSDMALHASGRYIYRQSYVEKQLTAAGLKVIDTVSLNLRREGADYAKGFVILAGKK